MKERGILIEKIDVQPVVEKAAEVNKEWEFSEIVTRLNTENKEIYNRFFHGVPTPGNEGRLPYPLISVDNLRNLNTLAAYQLVPDEYGFNRKIILNEEHFEDYVGEDGKKRKRWRFGEWALRESLTHEDAHDWQQMKGKNPYKIGKSRTTHNTEFCEKMESLGLHPMPGVGCHMAIADADKPFGILMSEFGIPRPEEILRKEGENPKDDWFEIGKRKQGKSSLNNWVCPECHLHARIGVKGNPEIIHAPCSEKKGELVFFVRAVAMLGMKKD
jgi:hypothetical protein